MRGISYSFSNTAKYELPLPFIFSNQLITLKVTFLHAILIDIVLIIDGGLPLLKLSKDLLQFSIEECCVFNSPLVVTTVLLSPSVDRKFTKVLWGISVI